MRPGPGKRDGRTAPYRRPVPPRELTSSTQRKPASAIQIVNAAVVQAHDFAREKNHGIWLEGVFMDITADHMTDVVVESFALAPDRLREVMTLVVRPLTLSSPRVD